MPPDASDFPGGIPAKGVGIITGLCVKTATSFSCEYIGTRTVVDKNPHFHNLLLLTRGGGGLRGVAT